MEQYIPAPLDTKHIDLPIDLLPLIESLAMNNHDEWALNRIKDGWTWGEIRSDEHKHHPCIIPYDDLPESEKEYDRILSVSTIKILLAMGYKITKI